MRWFFRVCLALLISSASFTASSAQISQPYAGDDTVLVTPNYPASPVVGSVDVFSACTGTAPSLMQSGTEHAVSAAGPMLLKLSEPLASGSAVCVSETYSGTNAPATTTFNAVVLAADGRPPAPAANISIEPATDGKSTLMIDPLKPAQGFSATVHVYSTCPPSGTAKQLDVTGISNAVGADGQKFPIRLIAPLKAGDTLCAVETYAGTNPPNPSTSATVTVAAAPAAPAITGITQFDAPNPTDKTGETAQYIAQIAGTNLPSDTPQVSLLPQPATSVTVTSTSTSNVMLSFNAPLGFSITQAVLSYKSGLTIESPSYAATTCQFDKDINSTFQLVDAASAKTMFGAGAASNFRLIKLSIVNQCPLPITIPLAGIRLKASKPCSHAVLKTERGAPQEKSKASVSPSSLDAVTLFYTEDKSVTGRRALFFNSVSALAAVGSGVVPFIGGKAFAQAIAFVGGGFTSSAQLLYKDTSAQQLQALTSLGFGNAEQLAARSGPLQKYLFISLHNGDKNLECAINNNDVKIEFTAIPTITSGVAQSSPAQTP